MALIVGSIIIYACSKEDFTALPDEQNESGPTVVEAGLIDTSNRAPTADFILTQQWDNIYSDQQVTFSSLAEDPESEIDSLIWIVNNEDIYQGSELTLNSGVSGANLLLTHRVVDNDGAADETTRNYSVNDNPEILLTLIGYTSPNTGDGFEEGELFFVNNAICFDFESDSCFTTAYPDVNSGGTPFTIHQNQYVDFSQNSGLVIFEGQASDKLGVSILSVDWDDPFGGGFFDFIGDLLGTVGSFVDGFLPGTEDVVEVVQEVSGHVQDYISEETEHDVIDQINILLLKQENWLLHQEYFNITGPNGSEFYLRIQEI